MTKLLIFVLLLLPLFSVAREDRDSLPVFSIASFKDEGIIYNLDNGWRFHEGDDTVMASTAYDDSNWDLVNSAMTVRPLSDEQKRHMYGIYDNSINPGLKLNDSHKNFSGIGWFRLHFVTDSSLNGVPLALAMTHYGASEIFLDGVKIDFFGRINGKDSCKYSDPQNLPFPLVFVSAGPHVLAVRYAYYDAERNHKIYGVTLRGFHMQLCQAVYSIIGDRGQTMVTCIIYILFFGIFLSLAMSHLFLYLYYRPLKSNLYFSLFCLSLCIEFLVVFLNRLSYTPAVQFVDRYVSMVMLTTACFSFSGFTNEIFSTKKWRFRLIMILCLVCPVIFLINSFAGLIAYCILIGTVLVQAIILIIRAMYKKVRGARILGSGILFFAFFLLTLLILGPTFTINEHSPVGHIFLITAALAILSIPVSLSLYLAWSFAGINKNLENQLVQVKLLSEQTLEHELEKKRILEGQNEMLEREVKSRTAVVVSQKEEIEKQHDELKIEKKKTDDLLLNILPEEVAAELKEKGYSEAKLFNDVTVLFTDFVDFTKAGDAMSAKELVSELHVCFKTFDEIISKYNIEKIKTIGDAYLAVCGLPLAQPEHAENVVNAALEIVQFMAARRAQLKEKTFEIRIGVHSGSVVAGIVGVKKFAYDIWGDTVNTAARMEQNSAAGKINISQTTFDLIKNKFECTYRGEINAKNKGDLSMYFVEGLKK